MLKPNDTTTGLGSPWASNGWKLTGLTGDVLGYGCSRSVCWARATGQWWRLGVPPAESSLSQSYPWGEKPSSRPPTDPALVVGDLLICNSWESSFCISVLTVNLGTKHLYSKHGCNQQSLSRQHDDNHFLSSWIFSGFATKGQTFFPSRYLKGVTVCID